MYYTYILRCDDGSLYTGITTDPKRRREEHVSKGKKAAKYTLNHNALYFEILWESESRSLASRLEYHIKTLTKARKEELIVKKDLKALFGDILEVESYKIAAEDQI